MTEEQFLALVERIQQAQCIVPFQPIMSDVVMLISMAANGAQHPLRVEDLERVVRRQAEDFARLSFLDADVKAQLQRAVQIQARLAESETRLNEADEG